MDLELPAVSRLRLNLSVQHSYVCMNASMYNEDVALFVHEGKSLSEDICHAAAESPQCSETN